MKSRLAILLAGVVATACMTVPLLSATPTATSKTKRLSFRTQRATTAHFNTEKEAKETTATLKQLGCETKTAQHDGHIDVTYECKFWRSLSVKETKDVAQWEKWLASKGFVVVHNTPGKEMTETVQYQLADWKSFHFHNPIVTKAHAEMFKMLGCEVKAEKHGDHEDLKVRCATWQSLGVQNHAAAHEWMAVLKKLGFKTAHEH